MIYARITNDEKALRRAVKKFHGYTSAAYTPIVPSSSNTTLEDAREAFLVELASFHLMLKKSMMICEAEARQVEEYQREKQRIADDRISLRGQIEQLKTSLEDAQLLRRRKVEYDQVAERINTLPSREELEQSISELENDIAAIQAEHETQNRIIHGQKSALGSIIFDLSSLRLMGKDPETSRPPSPTAEGPEDSPTDGRTDAGGGTKKEKEDGESSDDAPLSASLNPSARPFLPPSRRSTPLITPAQRMLRSAAAPLSAAASPSPAPMSRPLPAEDDIEMGEVSEGPPKDAKGKKKAREDLEEGEASDESSELSELPDD
ncbi:hypothetical protein JAAARDRAFT_220163 [Jaapia argillacea MUCL 33604]|uniref:Uncharacterized protein n=1 Tax=Jaapia argillacea MUCL 33604 TaxID=933084 RepID=A0A067QDI0_9AGAM|nr:hypothetical protein JAAARDRAFT_220163 [Jaapia argillacea MUCL 33604]